MSMRTMIAGAAAVAVLAAASAVSYWLGRAQGPGDDSAGMATSKVAAPADPSAWGIPEGEEATRRHLRDGLRAGDTDPATGRRILYYHDPMVPGQRFDAPAKSPFMDMMLVPAYAGGDTVDEGTLRISPRITQNLGMRTAEVDRGVVAPALEVVGTVEWNERGRVVLQARAAAFVERLHVRAELDRVAAGEALLDLYVPEWVAVQEEYLALRAMRAGSVAELVVAARQRMRQAGMSEAQIAAVERAGAVQPRFTLRAPSGGVVTQLPAREGMAVAAGATLIRIDAYDPVWVHAEVPDSQSALLRAGVPVRARTPAHPGHDFEGTVGALVPRVDPATRTLRARIELANPGGVLVPGMVMRVTLQQEAPDAVLRVPAEALIRTGRRNLVMLDEGEGRFRPVEVVTGVEGERYTEIVRGLEAGQRVVVSGQFLIDSEASLKGVEARSGEPSPVPSGDARVPADVHRSDAILEALDGDVVTLTHPPIPALRWPQMTMEFRLAPEVDAAGLEQGQQVEFAFRMQDGDVPLVVELRPLGEARP
ncbi:MAG: efflux RND transporter periplasmic adaptor subunit [Thauera sp.]|mgnify:CR=1 FL=1|nr:efflux RND transporter periplasmic adaptor subunit [Thauera sp.]